jgi:hypothetical protein
MEIWNDNETADVDDDWWNTPFTSSKLGEIKSQVIS